jgi:CheY-like chemotaxis protein
MQPSSSTGQNVTGTEKSSSRPRILVIDDNDDIRGALCDRLSAIGYEVAAEDNGLSGLARVSKEWETAPFDGVLVELQMPVLGGMAVLQELSERFPTVPVIVMADSVHETRRKRVPRQALRHRAGPPKMHDRLPEREGTESLTGTGHGRVGARAQAPGHRQPWPLGSPLRDGAPGGAR